MAGAKISKSAGKFPVVDDLTAEGINPLAFRLLCLGAKYRSELAFGIDAVRAAEKNLNYLNEFSRNLSDQAIANEAEWVGDFAERFREAINNDLNSPQALAVVLELVAEAYRRHDRRIWNTLQSFDRVLGLDLAGRLEESRTGLMPHDVMRLVDEREQARARKDFVRSDELRAQLEALGYIVTDTKVGPRVMPKRAAT
jgi:cysteinyl-tRNA synthetase